MHNNNIPDKHIKHDCCCSHKHHKGEKEAACHSEHNHSHSCCHNHNHNSEEKHSHNNSCDHGNCCCGHSHTKKTNADLIRISLSLIVFILSFLFNDYSATSIFLKISAVIICAYKIIISGITSLFKMKFTESTLMSIASIASLILGEFTEAYLIVILFTAGEFLEEYAVKESNRRIEKLISHTTEEACDEKGNKIDPRTIKQGDKFLVRSGDKVYADAKIIQGNTSFDTSSLTGESYPVDMTKDDLIHAGYINTGSAVVCVAVSDYSDSATSKIKQYVQKARDKKAKTEKFITRFASIYTPGVIIAAVVMGIVFYLTGFTSFADALKRALTFMIASCPCSLVISIPLAYYAALGASGKSGLLIKGSEYIDKFAHADAIAFDKTGTLTTGKITVKNVIKYGNMEETEILNYANALEICSSHPIAKAICEYAPQKTYNAENVKEYFGKGIEGTVNGHKINIGSPKNDTKNNQDIRRGVALYVDGVLEAVIELSDNIRDDARDVVQRLYKEGIKSSYIISGDNEDEVNKICMQIGNIKGYGNLLPEEKTQKIVQIKNSHKGLIFVGDGVNDAPSLAKADFSISMGTGSSLAIESGDSSLISGTLKSIVSGYKIAGYTKNIIYTNIGISLFFKGVVLVLATFGIAPIWLALLADVGILMISVINALSILYHKF